MDRRRVVLRRDPDGGVHLRRGRAADQERDDQPRTLHLARDVDHLVERRRDQTAQPDQVRVLLAGRFQDPVRRNHHAEIDDLEIVAFQNHAHDVLSDVVDVALDRRHDDPALG